MVERKKSHPLREVSEPNLLTETFPHSLPPLIQFDGPIVEYIDGEAVKFDPQTLLSGYNLNNIN